MKINLLVLRTPKLEEMRTFYSSLGAQFETEQHGLGPKHYAATVGDDFVLELYPAAEGAISDPGLRLGLTVSDIAETLRSIDQCGAIRQSRRGMRAVVHDPDGRTIELLQSPTKATSAA